MVSPPSILKGYWFVSACSVQQKRSLCVDTYCCHRPIFTHIETFTRLHTFSKLIYSQRRHRRYTYDDSSPKTTVLIPALSVNTNNSCSLVEMCGAKTLLFLMFAVNTSTQTEVHTDTDAVTQPVTFRDHWVVFSSHSRQAAVI